MATNSFYLARTTRLPAGTKSALMVLALAGALVLSGCTAKPEPAPAAPSTAAPAPVATAAPEPAEPEETPTPEPTEEPTPPDPSQLINENTEEGAISALHYFLELREYTFAVRDDNLWIAQTTEECEFCKSLSSLTAELMREDQTRTGGLTTVEEVIFAEEEWPRIWVVEFQLSESYAEVINSSGEVVETGQGALATYQMYLHFNDNAWFLEEISD